MKKIKLEANYTNVLQHIINNNGISKAELARLTGLNKSTISYITDYLLESKIILSKRINSKNKRVGEYLFYNFKLEHIICFEITDLSVNMVVTSLNGQQLSTVSKKHNCTDILNIIDKILLEEMAKYKNISYCYFIVLGAVIDQKVVSPFYSINNLQFDKVMEKHKLDFEFINHANCYSYGLFIEKEKAHENLINIHIERGIGAGLVINGEIFSGNDSIAGEIGHTIAVTNGKACSCGNFGCLEQYVSDRNFINEINDLTDSNYSDYSHINFEDVKIREILNRNILLLAKLINDMSAFLNPDAVIITSDLYSSIPGCVEALLGSLVSKNIKVPYITIEKNERYHLFTSCSSLYLKHNYDIDYCPQNRS